MSTSRSNDAGVLVIYPPDIPQAVHSVVGADVGISLKISDQVADGLGATVRVDPIASGTVTPGDVIQLFRVGESALLDSQIIYDVNAVIFLRIPNGRLSFDLVNQLFFNIVRGSQNIARSLDLTALYNKIRPGLKDKQPTVEGHSELNLLLPDEILKGVGADFSSAQVCVSYPYCRAHDVITLKCNASLLHYTVKPTEAPPPPNPGSAVPITVCFLVTRAFLDSAKRADQTLEFVFTVTDQLGNTVDPDALWSASQIVDENLDGTRFAPLIFRENQTDSGDVSEIVDLEKLGKNPLLLIVFTTDNRLRSGDIIRATFLSEVAGQPNVVVEGKIEADDFGQLKPVILPVANDKVISGDAVSASYEVWRNGVLIGISSTATARVVGEGLPELQPPRLQKSVDGVFDPTDPANLQGANGQVEVLGFQPGDTVRLIVEGAPGAGSPVFEAKSLNANSRANFPLGLAFVAANRGKSVKLHFLLLRNGRIFESPSLSVFISEAPSLVVPLVIGSRGTTVRYWSNKGSSRFLSALDPVSLQPLETVWQYEGDSQQFRGQRFDDLQPQRLLRVGSAGYQVVLQRSNIFGNGWGDPATPREGHAVLVALRDSASLVAWGDRGYGGILPPAIAALRDITEVFGGARAIAALRANGSVVGWGDAGFGGVVSAEVSRLTDVIKVTPGGYGFAVIRANGQVQAWGDARFGGAVPAAIAGLRNVVSVFATVSAFVALLANGQIVAWGDARFGAALPAEIAALRDIVAVTCNHNACVALRANGTVVGWGEGRSGGDVPADIARLSNIVDVTSSGSSFAVRLSSGRVAAWGNPAAGGLVPSSISAYTNVIEIIGGGYGFAVRLDTNRIDTWGDQDQGGRVPDAVARRDDIVQIASTNGAYAVLYADGTADAFGNPLWGGDVRSVASQLTGVRAIIGNAQAFAFLTADRRVVTAGLAGGGGNSDGVQNQLLRQLSYHLG
ncbi:RCC1 domain-containing protein [Pseudomonas sp. NPDC089741]|uniref:RCC1 domain-containing protein n=1 Tax=Pseudomonas sp. NPDC089741 TaxID=3364470 RepID=UPI00381C0160